MVITVIVYILLVIVLGVFYYFKTSHSYWQKRGVPVSEPIHILYGNAKESLTQKITNAEFLQKLYNDFKSQGFTNGGFYSFNLHFWLPVDIELIKNILTKDFNHFMNRDAGLDEKQKARNPIALNLFNATDDHWKRLRAKLTPTFTSGKIKMMFHTLLATTSDMKDILNTHATLHDPVEIKDLVSRFTTDVIGSCAFGLECNSLKNPSSDFRVYGSKMLAKRPGAWKRLVFVISKLLPRSVEHLLRPKLFDKEIEDFFRRIVNETVEYRERNNVFRKDFMHLLIQLKNRGKVTDDERLTNHSSENIKVEESMTMDEIWAQCILFFLAGFETSGTTISFALLEMAQDQDIQDKLRKEINDVLTQHGGQITYDAVMEMKYLDMVVNETLRKHPALPGTPRICTKDYALPDSKIIIERGTQLFIPIYSIHHDPEFYPDPEKFIPERFTESKKALRPPCSFIPFGEGPRFCIGARFGQLQTKVGLISIIKDFKLTINEKTKCPIKYSPSTFFLVVEGGIWLNVEKIL